LDQPVINNTIFSTSKVNIYKPSFEIDIESNIFSIGSCFACELSNILKKSFIEIRSNPFGTIYNIKSILILLERIIIKRFFTSDDIFFNNETDFKNHTYFSFETSMVFNSTDKKIVIDKLNGILEEMILFFDTIDIIIITPGTSVIYQFDGQVVANCHKLDQKRFTRKVLSVNETSDIIDNIVSLIHKFNPKINIIFTLSPVRHTLSDLVDNQYSKSVLRCSITEIISKNHTNIYYFPSYEIVVDELRNYCVYKDDMAHIKKKYIKYIVGLFVNYLFNKNSIECYKKIQKLRKFFKHKIISTDPIIKQKYRILLSDKSKFTSIYPLIYSKVQKKITKYFDSNS